MKIFSFIASLACLLAPMASAENRYEEQVRDQLLRAATILSDNGYDYQDVMVGRLNGDRSQTYSIDTNSGYEYAVIAVCDSDCSDVDLYATNTSGRELDRDIDNDDNPIVLWDGNGRDVDLRVKMYSCRAEPCYFGIGLFRK